MIALFNLAYVAIGALANSMMDNLVFRWHNSIFNRPGWFQKFFGPDSWKNKYMISQNPILLYLFRTAFVGFTDGWHFAQLVCFTAYQIPIALDLPQWLERPVWDFIINITVIKFVHWAVFETFFEKVFEKKRKSKNT